jgi:hypothetical protein
MMDDDYEFVTVGGMIGRELFTVTLQTSDWLSKVIAS